MEKMNERSKWLKDLEDPAKAREWAKMKGNYHCPELSLPAVRIGADDHQALGSRRGKYVYFKNGRKELA